MEISEEAKTWAAKALTPYLDETWQEILFGHQDEVRRLGGYFQQAIDEATAEKDAEIRRLREAYLFLGRAVIYSPSREVGACGQQTGMGMRRIQLDLSGQEYNAVVDETHRLGYIAREEEQNGNQ